MSYQSYSSYSAKPPPPKAAQKLPKQREIAEYASFEVRGLHVPNDPQSTRIAQGHRQSIKTMAFSPSGLILATAGLDRTVRFWDVKGFKELVGDADVKRKDEPISFSYNTSRSPLLPLTTASSSTSALPSTTATTATATKPTTTSESAILRITFSPIDDDLLVVVCGPRVRDGRDRDRKEGHDGPSVVLWNVQKANPHIIATFPIEGEFQTLAFHPSGYQIGIAAFKKSSWDAVTFLWDEVGARDEEKRRNGDLGIMDLNKEEKRTWTVRKDIKLGDKSYRLRDRRGKEWGVRELNGMCFSPCGTRVYAGETSGNVFAWEYPILSLLPTTPLDSTTMQVDSAPVVEETEGDTLESGTKTGSVTPALSGDGRGGSPVREEREEGDGNAEKVVDDEGKEVENLIEHDEVDKGDTDAMEVEESKQTSQEASAGEATIITSSVEETLEVTVNGDVDMTDAETAVEESPMLATEAAGAEPTAETSSTDVAKPPTGEATSPAAEEAVPAEVTATDVDGDAKMEDAPATEDAEEKSAVGPEAVNGLATASGLATKSAEQKDGSAAVIEEKEVTASKPVEPIKPKEPEIPAKMLKYLFQVGCHSGCANCLEIAPNGKFVATGGSEGVVNQIDLSSWITVRAYDSYTEEVRIVKCSYDGEWIAVTGDDRCVDIMSVATGTTAIRIPTKSKVECMAWVPSPMKSVLCYALEDHSSGAAGQPGDWFYVTL